MRSSTAQTSDERRLSEVARHVVQPTGIVSTGWPAARAKCRDLFGVTFDRWQDDLGRLVLGKRADGLYAASIGGVILAIPRQVAKTWFVLRLLFALCILFPGLRVLWTAHHTATLSNTFRAASGLARRRKVAPYVGNPEGGTGIRRGSGKEAILFKNGSSIFFGAREQGFGRGFDEIDVEVFDESQILSEKALDDMVAATNQARHAHGALLFYMCTPPRPTDPGEAITNRRADALSGESEDTLLVECSADADADPDDQAQWRKANPSFPRRTPLVSMLRLRKNLLSVESWLREALGIWDSDVARAVYPLERWDKLARAKSRIPRGAHLVFAVDVSWDRQLAHIAVAGVRKNGSRHVQVVAAVEPSDAAAWIEKRVGTLAPLAIAVQGSGAPASSLVKDLDNVGVPVRLLTGGDMAKAHGAMFDAIRAGRLSHLGEPEVRQQIATAVTRNIGAVVLDRMKSPIDISGLVAITEALWVLEELVGSADYDVASSVA